MQQVTVRQHGASRFDLLQLHVARPARYPFLLESSAFNDNTGRYDILFAFPGAEIVLAADQLRGPHQFLEQLDEAWQQERLDQCEDCELPFRGGWFLYLGYELAQQVEPCLKLPVAEDQPVAMAVRIPAAVIVDRRQDVVYLLAEKGQESLLDAMVRDIESLGAYDAPTQRAVNIEEAEASEHLANCERVLDYIREGDVFQVNLSRLWQADFAEDVDVAALYTALRRVNPAPFSALMRWAGLNIVSSSPERLLKVSQGLAETRPIAGTRPRARDDGGRLQDRADQALGEELLAHLKERAEHVMLLDLERNDLGRICQPGSVRVSELMVLESYAHVHHIVSNVEGRLRGGVTPGQAIAAVFPGGTITGCPKVRCMEIIAELEGEARGPYTGSLGYLNRDGDMDLNILIRTMQVAGRQVRFRAGGGIVADSEPEKELEETRTKAKGLRLALS